MNKTLSAILGLLLIVGISYIGILGLISLTNFLKNSISNLTDNQTTLLIALVPSSISILGISISNNQQKKRELEFRVREKKEKAYETLLNVYADFVAQPKSKKTEDELMLSLLSARKDLVLWGSDDVVRTYGELMQIAQEDPDSDQKTQTTNKKLEDVVLAIRKDLGYKNTNIKVGDLLRYFS